jgi:hypothetical protein
VCDLCSFQSRAVTLHPPIHNFYHEKPKKLNEIQTKETFLKTNSNVVGRFSACGIHMVFLNVIGSVNMIEFILLYTAEGILHM